MADLNFTAEIAGLKARNAELIQKIAEDEANLNQESFEKVLRKNSVPAVGLRGQSADRSKVKLINFETFKVFLTYHGCFGHVHAMWIRFS